MKRYSLACAVILAAAAAFATPATAAPNPNPAAPAHATTGCASVLAHNPNTGPDGHASETGGAHFLAVGQALCGLPS